MARDSHDLHRDLERTPQGRWQILEDATPMAGSLEWRLGREYYATRGVRAFSNSAFCVPYVATNDGTVARHAAEVCVRLAKAHLAAGELRGPFAVLEIGPGSGLFARLFLRAFDEACRGAGLLDVFARTLYFLAEPSAAMRTDLEKSGVLNGYESNCRIVDWEASRPMDSLREALGSAGAPHGLVNVAILNYVLDTMPASAFSKGDDGQVVEYRVQTLVRSTLLAEAGITSEESRTMPENTLARVRRLGGDATVEYQPTPVTLDDLPYGWIVRDEMCDGANHVVLNHGALDCVRVVGGLLVPRGFALLSDYGFDETHVHKEAPTYQRYGGATAIGVGFRGLKRLVERDASLCWIRPDQDDGALLFRAIGKRCAAFDGPSIWDCPSRTSREAHAAAVTRARQMASEGRVEQARRAYLECVQREPQCWLLYEELARFFLASYGDANAALAAARIAVDLNPVTSSELWCTLGDAHGALNQPAEAYEAYKRAITVDAGRPRPYLGLAILGGKAAEAAEALHHIASGLANDRDGEYRTRLLDEQQRILSRIAEFWKKHKAIRADHVLGHASKEFSE